MLLAASQSDDELACTGGRHADLVAGLLLSIWGLLVYAAPKRKRYGRWRRRREIGHSSIDGEDHDSSSSYLGGDFAGSDSADGGGDCGGDGGGGDGGGCGGGD